MPLYYQVVEGEQPFVTICAVLYDGELGRDLTVNLSIVNSSLGETGKQTILKTLYYWD